MTTCIYREQPSLLRLAVSTLYDTVNGNSITAIGEEYFEAAQAAPITAFEAKVWNGTSWVSMTGR